MILFARVAQAKSGIDTHNEGCLNLSFPAHQSGRIQIGHQVLAGHGPTFLGPAGCEFYGDLGLFNALEESFLPSNAARIPLGEI